MATALAPGLSRKLKKVLETRTDTPDLLASLNTLSSFYSDNNPHARRNLRSTIEKRSLSINHEFLLASDAAQQALDRVEEEVNALADCCDKIAKALNSCNATTGDIISTTERLKQELEITTQRQEIVSCFLRDYQLSNEEINALREEDLNENFFKALSHVQEIHANCKVLLRTHHQRAGLELMDMMAVYQEGAYERLCRWVQAECRRLGDTDNPEVNELLKAAVRCLKERPVLFKYCAEEVANMRHNAMFRRFISALTRGGPGGLPRPIEVHAHDPLRYVGDMLGWLHQALASERELVLVLLDPDAVVDTGPTARRFSNAFESNSGKTETDLMFVLDRIFEGVCRPFKVRVEQVLQSQPSIMISYKLTNNLEFYSYTISDLLGRETALCNTLWALKDAAEKTFFDILKTRGEKLLRYPPLVSVDLSPPPAVREGVSVLLEIIQNHDSMMVPASGKKPVFDPVIAALLDPIIQMCEQAAEAHKSKGAIQLSRRSRTSSDPGQLSKPSVDAILSNNGSAATSQTSETPSKIFLINCLCAIQQPLLRHEVASEMESDDDVLKGAVEVRRIAKESKEGRSNLALMGAIPPLVSLLDSVNLESQIASLCALLNLAIGNDANKAAIVKAGSVHKMLKLIESSNGTPNPALAEAVVANFLALSALDSNKPIIGSSGAIPFLVETLKDVDKMSSTQAKQDSLRALYNLSISPLNVSLILETDLVPFLFSRLGDMEISERILSILSNVVSTSEGRKGISIVPDVFPILIDALNWTDSPGCQEKASYILMIMAHKSYGDRQTMIEAGIASSLLELSLLGSTLAQKRASRILDRLRVDKGKQVSESFGGGTGANVSAPIVGSSSKSPDSNLESNERLEDEEGMMSEERKAVKQLVQQSLQNNMRRIVKRANLPQDFVPSDHLIKSLASSSTSKSLPF